MFSFLFFFFLAWLYLEEEILVKKERLTGVRNFQVRKMWVEKVHVMSKFVLPVTSNMPIVWCIHSFLNMNLFNKLFPSKDLQLLKYLFTAVECYCSCKEVFLLQDSESDFSCLLQFLSGFWAAGRSQISSSSLHLIPMGCSRGRKYWKWDVVQPGPVAPHAMNASCFWRRGEVSGLILPEFTML